MAGPQHQSRLLHADPSKAAAVDIDEFVALEEPSVPGNIRVVTAVSLLSSELIQTDK